MNDIVMPKLSDTMTEGRLVSWKKQVGETVRRGEVLAEVETDKANMELEAFTSGVLLEIRIQAGEVAQVGTVIAVIGAAEEKGAPPAQPKAAPQAQGAGATPRPAPRQAPAEPPAAAPAQASPDTQAPAAAQASPEQALAAPESRAPAGALAPSEAPPQQAGARAQTEARQQPAPPQAPAAARGPQPAQAAHGERAAPVVRRRARELEIDLGRVAGSGPDGRILLLDLERQQAAAAPSHGSVNSTPSAGDFIPLSRLRSAVAKTVAESWRTIPHFSVTTEVLMDEAEAVRRQLKGTGLAVTLNDLVIKGVALALAKFPRLNASLAADALQLWREINIGIAVGVPDGVLVPVLPGCQVLSLGQIAATASRLVEQARKGGLSEQEMSGGTFSVSNLGMYGVSQFSAVIYPSQAAVLAVGAVSDAIVARAGVPVCARLMKLTLSADHRIVDGAYAAEFLAELRDTLENPVRLLL